MEFKRRFSGKIKYNLFLGVIVSVKHTLFFYLPCVPQCPDNNFDNYVNKHVIGPKTLSHERLSHHFSQTHPQPPSHSAQVTVAPSSAECKHRETLAMNKLHVGKTVVCVCLCVL